MSPRFQLADPIDKEYEFGDQVDNKDLNDSLNSLSTVSYR